MPPCYRTAKWPYFTHMEKKHTYIFHFPVFSPHITHSPSSSDSRYPARLVLSSYLLYMVKDTAVPASFPIVLWGNRREPSTECVHTIRAARDEALCQRHHNIPEALRRSALKQLSAK